jgi:hypothetical protein
LDDNAPDPLNESVKGYIAAPGPENKPQEGEQSEFH